MASYLMPGKPGGAQDCTGRAAEPRVTDQQLVPTHQASQADPPQPAQCPSNQVPATPGLYPHCCPTHIGASPGSSKAPSISRPPLTSFHQSGLTHHNPSDKVHQNRPLLTKLIPIGLSHGASPTHKDTPNGPPMLATPHPSTLAPPTLLSTHPGPCPDGPDSPS